MAGTKGTQKEKPSMETVKEGISLSDFLTIEACNPLKEQLDKIEVCQPHLKSASSRTSGGCAPWWFGPGRCLPLLWCSPCVDPGRCWPLCWPNCRPYSCLPYSYCWPYSEMSRGNLRSPDMAPSQDETETEELTPEKKTVIEELKSIKAEIAALKEKLQ